MAVRDLAGDLADGDPSGCQTLGLGSRGHVSFVRGPELEQVAVRVVEVVGARLHPVEVDRAVDLDARLAHTVECAVQFVARYLEGEVNRAPARATGRGRLVLEEERPAMESDALRLIGLARPEPRPVVRGLVLERQPDDVAVEASRRRNVLDDQDELREASRAQTRCASNS